MGASTTTKKPGKRPRRSRPDWLDAALEALADAGEEQLGLRELCARLGVTTGSFYAHFHGRDDFVRSIAAYWRGRYTTQIAETIRHAELDPQSRLFALAEAVIRQGLARYDVAIRAWASHEPAVARIVRQVDEDRLGTLRDLFKTLGFRGADLDMRVRTFVTYYSFEPALRVRQSKRERLEEARRRIEMLTQPKRG